MKLPAFRSFLRILKLIHISGLVARGAEPGTLTTSVANKREKQDIIFSSNNIAEAKIGKGETFASALRKQCCSSYAADTRNNSIHHLIRKGNKNTSGGGVRLICRNSIQLRCAKFFSLVFILCTMRYNFIVYHLLHTCIFFSEFSGLLDVGLNVSRRNIRLW